LRQADNLLYVVKQYSDKFKTLKIEIRDSKKLAKDFFEGKSRKAIDFGDREEEELTEMLSLKTKTRVHEKIKEKMEDFDESADDITFSIFLESIMTEYKKIKKESWDTYN